MRPPSRHRVPAEVTRSWPHAQATGAGAGLLELGSRAVEMLWLPGMGAALLLDGAARALLMLVFPALMAAGMWGELRQRDHYYLNFSASGFILTLLLGVAANAAVLVTWVELGAKVGLQDVTWPLYVLVAAAVLNMLWLMFRAGPRLFWRFRLVHDDDGLTLSSRFLPRADVVQMHWRQPYRYVSANAPSAWNRHERCWVHVFVQGDHALAVGTGGPARREGPPLAHFRETHPEVARVYEVGLGPGAHRMLAQLEKRAKM